MYKANNSTICAISTAQGGAIGIVRVSGPDAIAIADSIFSKSIVQLAPYKVIFGNIIEGDEIIDEVLLTLFRAPNSYTGEDSVEISCHGSAYILNKVCGLLINKGCEPAKPGEFTQRAFLNGKMDLSQAEAVADLISSNCAASHRISMQQMRGGISKKLNELTQQLLKITSLLELELDFSEEDVEFADRSQLISLAIEIKEELQRLIASFKTGEGIKNGIPVAIIGAPNVGKSTLLNQLLHEDRAIVSDIQGTTRDLIEDTINISGIMFRFIDTAGIRRTDDKIELMGIERSISAAEKAQIIILMKDPGTDFPNIPLRVDQKVIRITNKTSEFQALTGKGLDKLYDELSSAIPVFNEEDVIITNVRHQQALTKSLYFIEQVLYALTQGISSDLVSEDLRQCISRLGEITGHCIDTETVLGNIFSNFCIGK